MNRLLLIVLCFFTYVMAVDVTPDTEYTARDSDTPAFRTRKACRKYMNETDELLRKYICEDECAMSLSPGNRFKVKSVKNGIAQVIVFGKDVRYMPAASLEQVLPPQPKPEDIEPEGRKSRWLAAERATTRVAVPMFALPGGGENYEKIRRRDTARAFKFLGVMIELDMLRYSKPGEKLIVWSQVREMVEVEVPDGSKWWIAAKYLRLHK